MDNAPHLFAKGPAGEAPYAGLEDILSSDRFRTHEIWAEDNRDRALELYSLNARLSECLHISMHMLEISLRNRIHTVMSEYAGPPWYGLEEYQLNPIQKEMIGKARQDLNEAKKTISPGRMVAALTFGYWTSLLGKEYESLWQQELYKIGRDGDGKSLRRKDFSAPLAKIRTLRNRVAHLEPILNWNLPQHHAAILRMISWLSPVAEKWCRDHCRFQEIYPKDGLQLSSAAAFE